MSSSPAPRCSTPKRESDSSTATCGDDPELRREVESLLAHDAGVAAGEDDPIGEVVGAAAQAVGTGAEPAASPLLGRSIGNIRVLELLGKGGMGEVYVGFDETLQRRVALKAIRARHRLSLESRARFLREARILSQLDHPSICRIHEYVEGDDRDFLVLELIEGRNLADAIEDGMEPPLGGVVRPERWKDALVGTYVPNIIWPPGNDSANAYEYKDVKHGDQAIYRPSLFSDRRRAAIYYKEHRLPASGEEPFHFTVEVRVGDKIYGHDPEMINKGN